MPEELVAVDSELLDRVRDVTDDVPGYVSAALRRQLDDQAFARLLDDLEADTGPVPGDLAAEAERFWRAP